MILIPQRLFGDPLVEVIFRDGNVCILKKERDTPLINREGYISNHVISILLEGEQQIRTYDDEVITVRKNEVLFIPRGVYHITDLIPKSGKFRSLLFYFDDSLIQEFLSTSRVTEISNKQAPSHLKFDYIPSLNYFAESLLKIYLNNQLQDKSFLNLKILELIYILHDLSEETAFASFLFRLTIPKKRNIRDFMESNFDKPLKIEDYAHLTGRSLSSFRRDFKSYFDITPQKWLKEKRMEKAVKLLQTQNMSVTELAYEVGYENISYFIKEFKNKVGISPKQYTLSQHKNIIQN